MKISTCSIRRLLSLVLCICMVLSLMPGVPLAALASGTNESDAVAQAASTYTVYCINSNKWSKVNAYAWTDNAGNASNWPGTSMTKTGKTVYGYDIYEITFNTGYQKVIFNNGSSQTGDLTFKNGQYYDLKSNTWYASLEDVPSPGVLAGSFNSWSSSANKFKMDAATPSIGYVSLELAANTKYEFKVIRDGSWLSCATPITGTVEKLTFSSSVSGNATITTTIEGTYVFAFSFTDSKLSVTYPEAGCDHVEETIAGKDATCTEDGLTDGVKCSACGEILTAQEKIPATGHNFVDGTCTTCGEAKYMTIYFQNNWKWTDVELYYWGSSIDKNPEWPGIAMERCGNDGTYDIYMLKVPTDITALIVNGIKDDGSGTRDQSPNIESGWYDGICYFMYWADGNQVKSEHIDTILPPTCNHVEQTVPGYAATCTEPGLTDGVICTVCGDTLVAQEVIPAQGHKKETVSGYDATCTEPGLTDGVKCSVCGETLTAQEEIPATGHDYKAVVTEPTCTEGGYTTYTCACGESYVADKVDALGHSYDEGVVTTKPTCTEDGVMTFTCGACGDTYTEPVAAIGHDYKAVVTKPTCTEDGYTTYTCTNCGDSYVADKVNALGHSYDEGVVTTDPTCTEDGIKTFTCGACGDTYTEAVAATGHDYKAIVTDPTCTEGGYTTYTCACGESYVADKVDALGHSYDEGVVTTDPTCTEDGVMTFTCGACGDTYTEPVAAIGHDYKAVVTEPTCTDEGYTTYTCTNCGDSYVADKVDALGHSYDEGVVTTDPTCTEDGVMTFTCGACGDTYTEPVAAIGHDYKAVVTKPTCTEDGYTTYTCTNCGDSYVADKVDALDHTYTNGFCTVCDGYEPAVDFDGDGYYEIDNAGKLYWFAALVNSGTNKVNAILTANIVVNEDVNSGDRRSWRGIGDVKGYSGIFDGDGHTISGLYNYGDSYDLGLFSEVRNGGIVRNVGVVNSYFYGYDRIGGIAGYIDPDSKVENCYNAGLIIGRYKVGGVVGFCSGTVVNCYNTGDVLGRILNSDDHGGVVGYCGESGLVMNCYNTGKLVGGRLGGVVGYCYSGGKVKNCYYLDTVCGTGIWGANSAGMADPMTAEQFASGEVAYLLNGDQSTITFYQTCGEGLPGFSGQTVYRNQIGGCTEATFVYEYSNTALDAVITHDWQDATCTEPKTCSACGETDGEPLGHSYDNGVCTGCGAVQTFTVTFAGYGTEHLSSMTVNFNTTIQLPQAFFGRNPIGYVFVDFNTQPDGSGESYQEFTRYNVTGDVTFYARWAELAIGGGFLNSGEYMDLQGNITVTQPDGGYAYFDNGTLTLHDFSYTGAGNQIYYRNQLLITSIYYHMGPLNLVLEGENSLTNTITNMDGFSVLSENEMTISGSGSLTAKANFIVMYSQTALRMESGTLDLTGGYMAVGAINGITLENTQLLIPENGTIQGDGNQYFVADSEGKIATSVVITEVHFHTEETVTGKAPTCTEPGLTDGVKCTVCGEILTAQEEIPATGNHIDADNSGRCDTCGMLMQPAKLMMATMSLEGNIGINYYMLLSDEVINDPTAVMQFTLVDDVIEVRVSDGIPTKVGDEILYLFTCAVNAKEMADDVLAQCFYKGGSTIVYTYSVKAYCEHILNNSGDEALKDLVKKMLNYGAASQNYFEYNTDNLANASLETPDYSDVVIDGFAAAPGQGTDLSKFYAASLILKSETTLRFFFTGPITATYNGEDLEVGQRSGLYYVDVTGIAAADLDEVVTITINDGTESVDITFNPMAYCQGVSKNTDDQVLKDMVAALYLYNLAANNFFEEN